MRGFSKIQKFKKNSKKKMSALYDSPSLFNVAPVVSSDNVLIKTAARPKSLKFDKENKEDKCLKCRVSFERLIATERQLKEMREEVRTIQREREMERESNQRKIQELSTRHQQDLQRVAEATSACSCVVS